MEAATRYRVADEQILDAACVVFADEGFGQANMSAIAAQGGVTKPTLYSRFGSKDELFEATVLREYELRKDRLFAAYATDGDEPFRSRLHRWVAAYFDFVRERPHGFRLISEGERHPGGAAIVERANSEIVDRIADLVLRVSRHDSPRGARLVAAMISGMLTSCAREAVSRGRTDLEQASALCEQFLHSALRGLDPELMDAVDRSNKRP